VSLWHYFYVPLHGPWYTGNVWGNVFVIAVVAPAAWLWSRTKFWPLRPAQHALAHIKHTVVMVEELHYFHVTGEFHPRVQARIDAGLPPTPPRPLKH
jgi:hypothetical protein